MSKFLDSHSGFTLIEVVVAFFITTVSLGVIFQIYAKGVNSAVLADDYAAALSIAESRLSEVSNDANMRNLEDQGTAAGRYDWELRTDDFMIADVDDEAHSSYSLILAEVKVSWLSQGKPRELGLQTLKPIILE